MEQISLHCSEGTLDWLYPKGALRLSLSPRLPSMAVGPGSSSSSGLITACVKPSEQFHGAQLYLERDGVLELLVGDRLGSSSPPRVRCFSRLPGERVALFLQATPHQDISRRIASFRYELRGDWTAQLSLDSRPINSEGESAMMVRVWLLEYRQDALTLFNAQKKTASINISLFMTFMNSMDL